MNLLTTKPTWNLVHSFSLVRLRHLPTQVALLALLCLPFTVRGQVLSPVTDNFNSYTSPGDDTNVVSGGWLHYNPGREGTTDGGQLTTWTFPDEGTGDKGYRMFGGPS